MSERRNRKTQVGRGVLLIRINNQTVLKGKGNQMARGINRDLWRRVIVRGEDGQPNREATIDALDAYLAEKESDQEKIGEVLHTVCKEMSNREFLPSGAVIGAVVSRLMGGNLDLYNTLFTRTKEVLDKDFEVARANGIKNPYFVKRETATAAE